MRQGAAGSRHADMRVPCLAGISEGALLALCAKVPQRTVMLVDAGDCASCDSGGAGAHPAAQTLHRVVELMREAGVPDDILPRFLASAGRTATRGERKDDPLQSRGRARRGLFTALARPPSAPPPAPRGAALSLPSPERRSTVEALQSLAARHGGRLPAALFHRLDVSVGCEGHRVCASACPTGALVRYREEAVGRMGIALDSAACIGCGHCAAVCPEQALQLQPGRGEAAAGHRPLTRFLQRECARCGARFASHANDAETRCERCSKSAQLARAAFATLFPARPRLRDPE
jgi:formate hydrogenlyase subunit 6/NADH:ubiquinone oxidoreductase subunit I